MWRHFIPLLRCPGCHGALKAMEFDRAVTDWIEAGVLLCARCRKCYPVMRGVPVLLPYTTHLHDRFTREHGAALSANADGFSPPTGAAPPGEARVMRSFSAEWLQYDFDGVIWEMDYQDHERRFLEEMGPYAPAGARTGRFLEVGCGLGITTRMAQQNFGGEAVGVDLSLAAWRAAAAHRNNQRLHFVQASVFALPFAPETFDAVYTRGVLHHTHSARAAFAALAPLCRPGGSLYVWVYGPGSINDNPFRRLAYATEVVLRFALNRSSPWLATAALAPLAVGYLAFNRVRHWANPRIRPYNYKRALHAARDRCTPQFAHRHGGEELCAWFQEAGFTDVEVVDWRTMPSADHADYRRNTGVRGRRAVARRSAAGSAR